MVLLSLPCPPPRRRPGGGEVRHRTRAQNKMKKRRRRRGEGEKRGIRPPSYLLSPSPTIAQTPTNLLSRQPAAQNSARKWRDAPIPPEKRLNGHHSFPPNTNPHTIHPLPLLSTRPTTPSITLHHTTPLFIRSRHLTSRHTRRAQTHPTLHTPLPHHSTQVVLF